MQPNWYGTCAALCLALGFAVSGAVADQPTDAQDAPEHPLVGTEWQVEDILGGGVVDRSPTTIEFVDAGRVVGNGGCNRYMGPYSVKGDRLSNGVLASTMRACPEALMNQEQRFHDAMNRVERWQVDPDRGLLYLYDETGQTVIRASRITAGTADDITP